MGVILTHHFSYYGCGFFIGLIAVVTYFVHGIQYPAVDGLKSISCIWQCPANNYRHRIIDVGSLHLLLDIYLNNSVVIVSDFGCKIFFRHAISGFPCLQFPGILFTDFQGSAKILFFGAIDLKNYQKLTLFYPQINHIFYRILKADF